MPHEARPIAVDLYSGAGGLSLGLEQAGFDVACAVEYDPVHAATHRYNFPDAPVLCDDASALGVSSLRESTAHGWSLRNPGSQWDDKIDLVAGGPPCQGFSTIGRRQSDDQRNDLVFHFHRLVAGLRPRAFLMENVPGIMSSGSGEVVEALVAAFERSGYLVAAPMLLNAASFGVPQNRHRFILVGWLPGEAEPFVAPATAVWDAIGDLPDADDFPELLYRDWVQLPRPIDPNNVCARRLAGLLADPDDFGRSRVPGPSLLTSSWRTVHTETSVRRFAATRPGDKEPISRFLRLSESGLCNTLRAGTDAQRGAFTAPRPIHPRLPRVITVREAARLHSYPDWFRFHATKAHGFRQVGNSVPPLLGRAVGRALMTALGRRPRKPQERPTHAASDDRLLNVTPGSASTVLAS